MRQKLGSVVPAMPDDKRIMWESPEWQAFLACPGTLSREVLGDLMRVAIGWSKRMASKTFPADLPDPAVDHCDWVAAMARLSPERWINLHDYQVASTREDAILNMTSASQRFSEGRAQEILEWRKGDLDGETIHCYRMTDMARMFWQNGTEQGLSSAKILAGWCALQGISDEIKGVPE